jgi:peptide-methionine (R)-S-oxide reductase
MKAFWFILLLMGVSCKPATVNPPPLSDEALKKKLTPEQYEVCRNKGTERPFQNKFWDFKGTGKYVCVACGADLFDSGAKYDSGTGWPSFHAPVTKEGIKEDRDTTLGMVRTEVTCRKCGSHLGHLFDEPTGLRYCINSASLDFVEKK